MISKWLAGSVALCLFMACATQGDGKTADTLSVQSLDRGAPVDRMANFIESFFAMVISSDTPAEAIAKIDRYCVAEHAQLQALSEDLKRLNPREEELLKRNYLSRIIALQEAAREPLSEKEHIMQNLDTFRALAACSPVPDDWN